MKKLYILLSLICFSFIANAQSNPGFFKFNDIQLYISGSSSMSFDDTRKGYCTVEHEDTDYTFICTSSLWCAGKVADSFIFWGNGGGLDAHSRIGFWDIYQNKYTKAPGNRLSSLDMVTKKQVDDHKNNWNKSGYVMPYSITYWPTDYPDTSWVSFGKYFDYNNNNEYDPENGDYPIIAGDMEHLIPSYSQKAEGTMQLNAKYYAFNTIPELMNVVFAKRSIHNTTDHDVDSMYFGIGSLFLDGYNMGTDTGLCMIYSYPDDYLDKTTTRIMTGIVLLNRPLQYTNYVHGNGTWTDYGLDYKTSVRNVDTNNVYVGYNRAFVSELCTGGGITDSLPFHFMQGTMSFGPMAFKKGESMDLEVAYLAVVVKPGEDSRCKLREKALIVKKMYYEGKITGTDNIEPTGFSLYPNPANSKITININQPIKNCVVNIYNNLGNLVLSQTITDTENSISVATLPKGIYYISLQVNNNSYTKKLIIN